MSLLTFREVILAKIETFYGVDPTPVAAADAILVEDPSWAFEGLRMHERPAVRPSFGKLPQVYGGALRAVSFTCEIKGSGTAGTPPEIGVLLRACGLDETIVVSTSVTYAPVSESLESCTIYYLQDGLRYILTGCRGNVSFEGEAGGIWKATFNMIGHSNKPADIALPAPTYDSLVPAPYLNATFTIASYQAKISKLAFDLTNSLAMPPDCSAADGYGEIQITGRDVNGSFDPELTLVADNAWESGFRDGDLMALVGGSIGAIAGNIINISMPAVQYRNATPGDRDGIRVLDMPYGAAESTTDDEVSIAFT